MFSCANLLMKHWNAVFESFGVDEEGGMSVEIRQFPNALTDTMRTVEDGTWGGGECAAPDEDGYQWRIQDFPQGGRQLPKLLLFFTFLLKTA